MKYFAIFYQQISSILSLNKTLLCYKHPQRLKRLCVYVIDICPKAVPNESVHSIRIYYKYI